MQIRRHGNRRSGTKLLMLLGFVFIVGISLIGASFWQPRFIPEVAAPAIAPVPAPAPVKGYATPPIVGAAYTPPLHAELPTPPPPPDFTPGEFAVPWQVAASQPVDAAYFYDAIFFGDSLLTGFVTHRLFGGAAIVAVIDATPASVLEEPLTMLEAAQEKGDRSRVYIMLGSQSLGQYRDEFVAGYQQFINAVRAQYPGATIYIMGLLPVAVHVGSYHPHANRERVIEFNAAIAELARANGLPFLNVFDALAGDNGYLPAHASSDGLHLSAEYYFILRDFLKAHTA